MIIDGKQIAGVIMEKLKGVIAVLPRPPKAGIIIVGNDPVIESFVRLKKKRAIEIGIELQEYHFPHNVSEEEFVEHVTHIAADPVLDAVIIQLPLPPYIAMQRVLDQVPPEKDVDMLSTKSMALYSREESWFLPPVAGAVKEILDYGNIHVDGKDVLILGYGRLVGIPVSIFMRHNGAHVTVIDRPVTDLRAHIHEAAVVVSGVGHAGLITPEMVTPAQILIDAGTSESGGKLQGDIDPACSAIARLISLVPGGVGPITIAILLKNICSAAHMRNAPHALQ